VKERTGDGKRGKIMADENYSYAPKYVQIQNYILQKIESGEYTAGDKIPVPGDNAM